MGDNNYREPFGDDISLLVVDDSADDRTLIIEAFKRAGITNSINEANSGSQAIAYIKGEGPYSDRTKYPSPTLIISDLNMPNGNGHSLLEYIKNTQNKSNILAFMISSSKDQADVDKSYWLGAKGYYLKPTEFAQMVDLMKIFADWLRTIRFPSKMSGEQNSSLEKAL